jgi:gamma-butyrobetaine dioxygenase/trimethyllysine dioxygenase
LQHLLDIPNDIAPARAMIEGRTLRITWAGDAHESTYDSSWLRNHAYSPPALRTHHCQPKTLWDGDFQAWPAVEWDSVLTDVRARHRLHATVAELGFVLVRGLGTDHDTIESLAGELGYIRETHYGRLFDLITRHEPIIVADLAGPMLPHTDEAYRGVPTGINIFHCLQPGADGGLTQLVDAHYVASLLKAEHPTAFQILTTQPIRHERRIDGQVIVADVPPIILDHDGNVIEVRLNERTMTAVNVPEELMLDVYAALRTVLRLAYDPARRIAHQLEAGEALICDNLRVLHGRTGYSGGRHLRQTQVMRDEFYAKGASVAERVTLEVVLA